ncbi:transcriptional regulator [Paenibacillus ferrarius]|uniref:Transcriptional regulator n=1 Tax=Paenibacillus ferrarius TaxID=1469647 RepID=A0A1V4HCV5_9BACL|nr:metalloregulator ArsR/SmtB family transcription factor [Paenibacillus ferrarius]OPH51130.1 transcriptional regulator [Paenibacillus ferrarius]
MNSIWSAIAEPNRLRIVELLRQGALSVGEVADHLGFNQPLASKHLRVFCDAGLVEMKAVTNRRIYKLLPQAFIEIDSWVETYLHLWEERFDTIRVISQELQGKEVKSVR